jgi:hypothetical protein
MDLQGVEERSVVRGNGCQQCIEPGTQALVERVDIGVRGLLGVGFGRRAGIDLGMHRLLKPSHAGIQILRSGRAKSSITFSVMSAWPPMRLTLILSSTQPDDRWMSLDIIQGGSRGGG